MVITLWNACVSGKVAFLFGVLLTVGVGLSSADEIKTLQEAENALQRLKQNSADAASLKQLPSLAIEISDDTVKGVLVSTFALASLSGGDVGGATKAAQFLLSKVPTSPYLDKLRWDSYKTACPKCKGTGSVVIPCPRCSGKRGCSGCAGRGVVQRLRENGNMELKRLGGETETRSFYGGNQENCWACRGSGRCKECQGSGTGAGKCPQCGGSQHVLSVAKAKEEYLALLEDGIAIVHSAAIGGSAQKTAETAHKMNNAIAAAEKNQSYESAIDILEKALSAYAEAPARNRAEALMMKYKAEAQFERQQLAKGLVKINGSWMTPVDRPAASSHITLVYGGSRSGGHRHFKTVEEAWAYADSLSIQNQGQMDAIRERSTEGGSFEGTYNGAVLNRFKPKPCPEHPEYWIVDSFSRSQNKGLYDAVDGTLYNR
jgi:hypothetical protein